MRIAIASGKGGTGKTTVATSLALSLMAQSEPAKAVPVAPFFLDCDVEAPNAHLFLKPVFNQSRQVGILVPQVDETSCTYCAKCVQVCQYHAIAVLGKKALVFPQLCHGCGSCTWMCPEGAISEALSAMGMLESGTTPAGLEFARGVLNVGEPMAVPVIRQLKKWIAPRPNQITILDAPPGTSCPVVETVRGADFLLLVTEPTPFGLHDLKLAVKVARELDIPVGVVINRDGVGSSADFDHTDLDEYLRMEQLPVLMRIPFDKRIAEGIARGKTLVEIDPHFRALFLELYLHIQELVLQEREHEAVSALER